MATESLGLTSPIFQDADKAREYLESVRWPDGPSCPHCGVADEWTALKGKKHRPGLYQCNACRQQFTVTVGTLFERSKVPLNKWLLAAYLLCSSKKGISSHQLHRALGVTYKTAWFMTHRIREAMRTGSLPGSMGGNGKTVEVDETFWGNKKPRHQKKGRGYAHKEKILTLVERDGSARSYHVAAVNEKTLVPIIKEQIHKDSTVYTDEAGQYIHLGNHFKDHAKVTHGIGEYVRGPIHTNTIEGFFSILKRGLTGVYQHVSKEHLKRYLCEFDFRYNTRKLDDGERTLRALQGIEGKRLTYRRTDGEASSLYA